ncbi:MAG: hypothetical protein P8182_18120 [Deltaproteobacteria bacterium]
MSRLRRHLTRFIAIMIIFGWVSYPGWYYEYYFDWPEKYAYPASFSNCSDPPWGFWFW